MEKHYLHLSAYRCDTCDGPVIAGSTAVRENEISKETDIRHVGASRCDRRSSSDDRFRGSTQSCRTTLRSELWTCRAPAEPPA